MDKKYFIPPIPFILERGLDMLGYTNEIIGWTLIILSIALGAWVYFPFSGLVRNTRYIALPDAVTKIFNKRIKTRGIANKESIPYEIWRTKKLYGIRKGATIIEPLHNQKSIVNRIDEYNTTKIGNIEYISLYILKSELKDILKNIK